MNIKALVVIFACLIVTAGFGRSRNDLEDVNFWEQLQIVESAGQSTCAFYVMRA